MNKKWAQQRLNSFSNLTLLLTSGTLNQLENICIAFVLTRPTFIGSRDNVG